MDCKSLMIGDLVKLKTDNDDFVPCKIGEIGSMLFVLIDGDEIMDVISYYDVEPIPLTKEILEANGFSIAYSSPTHTMLRLYEESKFGVQCKIFARHPEEVRIMIRGYNKSCIEIVVNYVHEFQRALRCCGLNDLADNFKID